MVRAALMLTSLVLVWAQPQPRACVNPTCSSPPCAAAKLGDVGCTTVSGTEQYKHELIRAGGTVASNAHIFGPFEAGFTSQQASIISNWGCSDPSVVYDSEGGKDIGIAEAHVAHMCNIEFPRLVGTTYYGVVGPCGGHTSDYHFHRSFSCLFSETGTHSTKVGVVGSWNIYGKWEDYSNSRLPYLDACGGHFGPTPESTENVYHYHAQDKAPFTVGCHGPAGDGGLVSISTCRSLYRDCSTGATRDVETATGTVTYRLFCPCYDASGSNMGTEELPALSTKEISYDASTGPALSPTAQPSPAPSADADANNPSTGLTPSPIAQPSPAPSADADANNPSTGLTPSPTASPRPPASADTVSNAAFSNLVHTMPGAITCIFWALAFTV